MADYIFSQGGADPSIQVVMRDSSGNAVTGLTASDFTVYYQRPNAAPVQVSSLSDLTAITDAHTDGGIEEVDATNWPGLYRIDLPDAVIATGENWAWVMVIATGTARAYGLLWLDPMPSVVQGAVNDASATTTSFVTDLSESQDDQFIDAFILFRTGANAGVAKPITDYVGSSKTMSCEALPAAPADTDQFVIINR